MSKDRNRKIYGFYHVALMGEWKYIVESQIKRIMKSGLYAKTEKIFVGVVGGKLPLILPSKFEIIYESDNLKEYEYPTLMFLQEFCIENPNDFMVWYIHTKGVRHNKKSGHYLRKKIIRNKLEKTNIDDYKDCIKILEEYDICGVSFNRGGSSSNKRVVTTESSHIGGNFWWANSDYIRTFPKLTIRKHRTYAETWKEDGFGRSCNIAWYQKELKPSKKIVKQKTKIYGFYHIVLINHWRDIVKEQIYKIQKSDLYDRTEKIFVGVVGGKLDIKLPEKFEITYEKKRLESFEFPTIARLQSFCYHQKDNCHIWYLHTKGANFNLKSAIGNRVNNIRKMAERVVIGRHIECNQLLDEYGACGWRKRKIFITCENLPKKPYNKNVSELSENYADAFVPNFWWANSDYVKTTPFVLKDNRLTMKHIDVAKRETLCEAFIGRGKKANFYAFD